MSGSVPHVQRWGPNTDADWPLPSCRWEIFTGLPLYDDVSNFELRSYVINGGRFVHIFGLLLSRSEEYETLFHAICLMQA